MTKSAIQRAVDQAGGQAALARLIGTSQQLVFYWVKQRRAAAEHVLKIEEATGISRHDLRPDIYPREDAA